MTMPRETGSEMGECANCGGPVPIIESAYGSTSTGACPKCFPAARETASVSTPRELGTVAPGGGAAANVAANEGSQGGES